MSDDNTTIVYAVRHGETQWNQIGKQQGHLDSPLTENGIQQAHALAGGLCGSGIEVLYSSDLGRAVETADIIGARLNLAVRVDPRLRERHLGLMQGLTKAEFRKQYGQAHAAFESGNPDYVLPGGESVRQRYERCVDACDDLAGRHPGQSILLVVHGGVLDSLICYTLGISLERSRRYSLYNGAINRFSILEGVWRMETWGDTSYLKGIKTLDDN